MPPQQDLSPLSVLSVLGLVALGIVIALLICLAVFALVHWSDRLWIKRRGSSEESAMSNAEAVRLVKRR